MLHAVGSLGTALHPASLPRPPQLRRRVPAAAAAPPPHPRPGRLAAESTPPWAAPRRPAPPARDLRAFSTYSSDAGDTSNHVDSSEDVFGAPSPHRDDPSTPSPPPSGAAALWDGLPAPARAALKAVPFGAAALLLWSFRRTYARQVAVWLASAGHLLLLNQARSPLLIAA